MLLPAEVDLVFSQNTFDNESILSNQIMILYDKDGLYTPNISPGLLHVRKRVLVDFYTGGVYT